MSEPVKLKATVSWEYEADPLHYHTSDPVQMAKIDEEQDPVDAVMGAFEPVLTVEPVDTANV